MSEFYKESIGSINEADIQKYDEELGCMKSLEDCDMGSDMAQQVREKVTIYEELSVKMGKQVSKISETVAALRTDLYAVLTVEPVTPGLSDPPTEGLDHVPSPLEEKMRGLIIGLDSLLLQVGTLRDRVVM